MSILERALVVCGVVFLIGSSVDTSFGARVEPRRAKSSTAAPELPRILSARVVLGTKFGTAVRVSYCYSSLPSDPSRRPARLRLTVDNLRDTTRPLSVTWPVTTRCNTVIHPVGAIQQPYTLRYTTEAEDGTQSEQGQLRLALLPELARRPALPKTLVARVVTDTEYGKALRISYCFRSLPSDRSRRPSTLWVTIEARLVDPRDAGTLGTTAGGPIGVKGRCGEATFPVKGFAPPYRIFYSVVSKNGTRSKRAQITVR